MAVYIRTGKRWGVGLPFWLAMLVWPVWVTWFLLVMSWNILVATWYALVWSYKGTVWLCQRVAAALRR